MGGTKKRVFILKTAKLTKRKIMTTEEILKKFNISLIYDHAIYFEDLKDTAFGVLAEDTNYMIKNIGKKGYPSITTQEIEENLKILRGVLNG